MEKNLEKGNDNLSENNDKPQSKPTQEAPFKRPTLLIGKRGRLPRKLQPVSTCKSSENCAEDIANKHEDKLEPIVEKPVLPNPEVAQKDKRSPIQQQQSENQIPLPYKEPSWSGLPESSGRAYVLEVLKNGSIIETIDLMKKPFWVFGRLATCDICMQHPTISRHHLVLQYRDTPSEADPPGFYAYDLGSTHGSFLNGKNNKLKPRVYAPIRVGHMLRLGCSQRSYILTGPEEDQEDESELTVTELKQLRAQKIKEHEEKMKQAELEREEKKKRDEERGVDWGLGDDADETEDLSENPYASTNNEELYLDDPKKALRGFFEREGLELEYDCSEQGLGQFLCKVELPLDDEMGRPIVAEVLHRGKKKEAVIQCALEACRILDRFGVLRQATHESRKRKTKNWEEDDYYDSDDDTFLDRTGTVEKKREKRMKAKEPGKVETYESLLEKEKELTTSILEIETRLSLAQAKLDQNNGNGNTDEDSLDSYMKGLQEHKPDRQTVSKLKFDLAKLKKDHANVIKLANVAKPADLPALVPQIDPGPSTSKTIVNAKPKLPVIGKRKTTPAKYPLKPSDNPRAPLNVSEDCEEESEDEVEDKNNDILPNNVDKDVEMKDITEDILEKVSSSVGSTTTSDDHSKNNKYSREVVEKTGNVSIDAEKTDGTQADDDSRMESDDDPSKDRQTLARSRDNRDVNSDSQSGSEDGEAEITWASAEIWGKHKEKLLKILNKLKRLASNEDRMHVDWKTLAAKKRKVTKLIDDLRYSESNEKLEYKVSAELNRILSELNTMTEEKFKVIGKVKKMGSDLKNISIEIDKDLLALKQGILGISEALVDEDDSPRNSEPSYVDPTNPEPGPSNEHTESKEDSAELDDKKKKKNQKRIEQRQQKAEMEKQRGYEEDASRENYSMWVPPDDQSGDGRTNLNDKYGY